MAEPITLILVNSGTYDGASEMPVPRNSLAGPGPVYEIPLTGGGVIDASFFGLVPANNAKLISISALTDFPGAIARVTRGDTIDPPLEQVRLSSSRQRLFLAGGDVLRVMWSGDSNPGHGTTRRLQIVVQDLSESEATPIMRVEHRPRPKMDRFVLLAPGGAAFSYNSAPLSPQWQWDANLCCRKAELSSAQGYIQVSDLVDNIHHGGIYVWARFAGLAGNTGDVGTINWRTAETHTRAVDLPCEKWSPPIWLSVADRLVFKTPAAGVGQLVSVELDVSPAQMRRVVGPV